jgi:hypothetical protein
MAYDDSQAVAYAVLPSNAPHSGSFFSACDELAS